MGTIRERGEEREAKKDEKYKKEGAKKTIKIK